MTTRDDPAIEEIRRIRHGMSERFGHDPRLLIKFLQEQEKKHANRVVFLGSDPQKDERAA